MRWYHRYHQDYDTKPTRSGKVGQVHFAVTKKDGKTVKEDSSNDKSTVGMSKLTSKHDREWEEIINGFDYQGNVANWIQDRGYQDEDNIPIFLQAKKDQFAGIPDRGKKDQLTQADIANCNLGFGNPGTTQNCAKCTASLELRRRGFDVVAGRQTDPTKNTSFQYWFNNAVAYKETSDTIDERLEKFGRHGTASLSFRYPNGGGGHAMYYYKDRNTGNPFYVDGQCNRVFTNIDDVFNNYGFDRDATITATRLDNSTPNWDNLAEDSVCRRQYSNNDLNKVRNKTTGRIVDTW